jgi:hypothetical protein
MSYESMQEWAAKKCETCKHRWDEHYSMTNDSRECIKQVGEDKPHKPSTLGSTSCLCEEFQKDSYYEYFKTRKISQKQTI